MERSFSRSLDALREVVSFVDDYAEANGFTDRVPVVQLVVEEIFTNMVRHNADGKEDLDVGLERMDNNLVITITDSDSEHFDIRDQKPVDVSAPLNERRPGGLGIHLVTHLVDEILYHYKDGVSVITLTMKLEPLNV